MKRHHLILTLLVFLLSACNVTLAEDITPPPGYVHPTPVPTLVLFPAKAPNVANGEAIYAEKCAACHGDTGLGDGEQGIQLGVTVRAFGLPEIARPASPAQYYTMVTRGNIERFMPPFASLNDQERWDVTAYVLTLHTTPQQIARGKELFEKNCADCPAEYFKNQQVMSTLTAVELARIVKQGNDQIPAFGADFNDDDLWATAAYLRTLSFDDTPLDQTQGEPAAAVATFASPEANPAVPAFEAQPGLGNVRGAVENKTGEALPSNLVVTLTGYDHDANNPNAAPVESLSAEGTLNADGSYSFENIEMPANRIFVARVTFAGVTLQSGFAIAEDGAQVVEIPALTIYPITEETTGLVMDSAQIIFDYAADSISVYTLYSFRNPTDKIIVVPQDASGEIPFIKFPEGSFGFGFEPTQDSEPFVPTENGFAIPPSDKAYGLLAFSSLGLGDNVGFSQAFAMPVASVNIFAPLGVTIKDSNLVDLGVQTIQGFQYQLYESDALNAGESLRFTLSGNPQESSTASGGSNTGLLIGAAALGLAFIGAGLWIYRQDKLKEADDEEQRDEFESAEDVMDAIIALDDLHGRKKIGEQAYQKRRAELKEAVRRELEK
ncbi:MAG: c-type cytochrome [Anaerolineales bacterium]|nr:c-type cytochrome [Anaerolineales bacterium]